MAEVTTGQIVLLLIAAALFAAGAGFSFSRLRSERDRPDAGDGLRRADPSSPGPGSAPVAGPPAARLAAKVCLYLGFILALVVQLWHSWGRGGWLPLEDNFDALVSLGLLLTLFVQYTQYRRPLRGLDWFVMPMVVLLLVAAAVFGRAKPHEYGGTAPGASTASAAWSWVHLATAFGGAAAFAVGFAGGTMFLIVSHRLRNKSARPAGRRPPVFGSLERLEHLMMASVTLGFALLTVAAVTGLVIIVTATRAGGTRLGAHWFLNPKVLLSAGAWLVYAVVLHSPINPAFRGRRAAVLSVVGFGLMVGTLVAVQFMPS